jgi:hypothetical protein
MREPKEKQVPRIGRKDLQDPDRERSDRDAGAGRPVQLDEEGRSHRPGTDSPRPADDGAPETTK